VDVQLTVDTEDSADQLRSLRTWLLDAAELRGRVTAVESSPPPGTMGPALDALMVVLAPGGVAAAFVPALIAWIRQRRSDVTVRLTLPDGTSVEVTASQVRGADATELRAQVTALLKILRRDAEATVTTEIGRQPDGAATP
jgi:hypothetical protein